MGDRTHVTLTLDREAYERVKNEPWFEEPNEIEDIGIPTPAGNRGQRSLTMTGARVDLEYEEVNYGELEFLGELADRGIAYDSHWGSGGIFPEGEATCRFNATGERQLLDLNEGEENPPISELMARITQPNLLVEYIKQYKERTTPWPWDNQTEYGKRYLALGILRPNDP